MSSEQKTQQVEHMNPSIEVEVRSSRNDPVLKTIQIKCTNSKPLAGSNISSVKLAQIGSHVKSVANLNGLILQND